MNAQPPNLATNTELPATPITALERKLGASWTAIHRAQVKTDELMAGLKESLKKLEDPHCTVVVTGSLGRGEASEDSDADWVLLVDGPSDANHARIAREASEQIKSVVRKAPGSTGTFGNIVSSHDLVHYIAGTRDTNENLTRRILLLAESRPLTSPMVRKRVIGNILARYVLHDRSVQARDGRNGRIPHFLLNDVVRYWRTMASDYASKMWERSREGWGTRNVKLRFSRKLLFIWGILASFSGELFASDLTKEAADADENDSLVLLSHLISSQTEVTPLELLARVASDASVRAETASDIFSAYDAFLGALSDPEKRSHLEALKFERAADDSIYNELRDESDRFKRGVNALFFDEHTALQPLIRAYGVF